MKERLFLNNTNNIEVFELTSDNTYYLTLKKYYLILKIIQLLIIIFILKILILVTNII